MIASWQFPQAAQTPAGGFIHSSLKTIPGFFSILDAMLETCSGILGPLWNVLTRDRRCSQTGAQSSQCKKELLLSKLLLCFSLWGLCVFWRQEQLVQAGLCTGSHSKNSGFRMTSILITILSVTSCVTLNKLQSLSSLNSSCIKLRCWDSNQWFWTEGRNKDSTRTQWRNKNSQKWRQT